MDFSCLMNHKPKLGLGTIFDKAQKHGDYPALISSMFKCCRKEKTEDFTLEFLQCLSSALVQKEKSTFAISVLEFAAKFCCHHLNNFPEEAEDLFLKRVVNFIALVGDGKHTVARLRICEFISLLLSNMSAEATIDNEIFDIITQTMLDRAKDKLPSIRVRAFAALQRLQDPKDNNCPVTKAFIFHLECDRSADVRKNILKNIAITQHSLPAIISRSRDFNEFVRKEMYHTISKIRANKRLRIRQIQELLTNGLNDSSEVVRNHVTKKLIPTWFDECDRDYIKLLDLFYVESYSLNTINALLLSLFKRRASADLLDIVKSWQNPDKIIPFDDLSTEKVVMWLAVVKYFRDPPADVKIEKDDVNSILPELTYFANYLDQFSQKLVKNDVTADYILARLLDLVFQFSVNDDEKGRQEMIKLCRKMLLSPEIVCEELLKILVKLITFLEPDINDRIEIITLVINDIQHPLEGSDKDMDDDPDSDMIESSLSEMENLRLNSSAVSSNVDNLEFADIGLLPKCLIIFIEMIKSKDIYYLPPMLDTFQETFLNNCFNLENSYISSLGISALSLLCFKDEKFAKANFLKFLIFLESDTLEVSSLEAIFDQLVLYGFDICHLSVDKSTEFGQAKKKRAPSLDFYDDPTLTKTSMKHLMNRLSNCLFSQILQIRSIACQGLAKLLLTSRIRSSFVLAKLVMLWFSPELGSDSCVSQPLGIFFDFYSKKIPISGEVILNALIPALDHLTSKECDPCLATVDPLRVASLMLNTLKNAPSPPQGPSYHFQAANLICDEILIRGIKSEQLMFTSLTKSLSHLEMSKSDKKYSDELLEKLPTVLIKLDKLKEKSIKKIAVGFYSKLNSLWSINRTDSISSLCTSTKSSSKDGPGKSTDSERNGDSNVTIRRHRSKVPFDPVIEEFSGSEDEDNNFSTENGDGGNVSGFSTSRVDHINPSVPETEASSDEEVKPQKRSKKKPRRLII